MDVGVVLDVEVGEDEEAVGMKEIFGCVKYITAIAFCSLLVPLVHSSPSIDTVYHTQ